MPTPLARPTATGQPSRAGAVPDRSAGVPRPGSPSRADSVIGAAAGGFQDALAERQRPLSASFHPPAPAAANSLRSRPMPPPATSPQRPQRPNDWEAVRFGHLARHPNFGRQSLQLFTEVHFVKIRRSGPSPCLAFRRRHDPSWPAKCQKWPSTRGQSACRRLRRRAIALIPMVAARAGIIATQGRL
jgi:hypothetical protein